MRTLSSSRQTPQLLEQVDMEVEVTIASDRSSVRGMCPRTSSDEMRLASISEIMVPEAIFIKKSVFMSVDTLLDWADTGMDADTTERLRSLPMT